MRGYLLLLVVVAFSSSSDPQQISSSSSSRRSSFVTAAAAQSIELVPLTAQTLVSGVLLKNDSSPADKVAPAAVVRRYRPGYPQGGGRWHGFDYGDDRNNNPTRYCPRSCRTVSRRVCDCQCVTRSSLNWYYLMRRRGQWVYPTCCYLSPPSNGGGEWWGTTSGGSSSGDWGGGGGGSTTSGGGTTSGGSTTSQQTVTMQTYSVGRCSAGGLAVIENSLKGFIATLTGVNGNTVQVREERG